ncbi:MAG: hypothetical protein ACTSXL_05270 [Alphaproteobacteria bacterium]
MTGKTATTAFDEYYYECVATNKEFLYDMSKYANYFGLVVEKGEPKAYDDTKTKFQGEKNGKISDLNDIIRLRLWDETLNPFYKFISFLKSTQQTKWVIHEIRSSYYSDHSIKSNWEESLYPHLYRDLKVIVRKNDISENPVRGEVQMHLYGFEKVNKQTHKLYKKVQLLTEKLHSEKKYFTEEDLLDFLDLRFKNIALNESATFQYNLQASQNNEIILLPGRKIIEKIAKQKIISPKEQMLNMATKGLLKEDPVLSVKNVKNNYREYILEGMNEALPR